MITATVRKNEYSEWVVRFRENGIRKPEWDYFTPDYQDALDTMKAVIEKGETK